MTLTIHRFDSPAGLMVSAGNFLLHHEVEHNVLLGILSTLDAAPAYASSPPYLAVVREDSDVVVAGAMTPPFGLVVSLCDRPEALRLLVRNVLEFRPETPGVLAPEQVARDFAALWKDASGQSFHLALHERCYRLDAVSSPEGVAGFARRARHGDLRLLTQWLLAFQREAVPHEQIEEAELKRRIELSLTMGPENRGIFVWEDGEPVCMAGYGSPTPHSLRVGPVFTPPEQRRRGYASACTAAVCSWILESGMEFCTLFADLSNPTSNHIYQSIGFRPAFDAAQYVFERT